MHHMSIRLLLAACKFPLTQTAPKGGILWENNPDISYSHWLSMNTCVHRPFMCQVMKHRAPFQYKDCLSSWEDFHYKDKTASGPSYLWLSSPMCSIYASMNWISIGSDNGLWPILRQAITWTNANLSYPSHNEVVGGILVSLHPSVRPSVPHPMSAL